MHWIKSKANLQERDTPQTQNLSLHKHALLESMKIDLRVSKARF